jgi:predicted nicotinamide N-methyase
VSSEAELVRQSIAMPAGRLSLLQPSDAADIPDAYAVEWAPIAPYWSVLWRSGVALARELDPADLEYRRVIELGCGLAVPSMVAARAGAAVLATDAEPEALALATRNAELNGTRIETARVEWRAPEELLERAPFDLVLAADVLYERTAAGQLLDLLPKLGPLALVADPGRPAAAAFLERARERWDVETVERGVVAIHRIRI